jgi:hypothetical protein
VEGAVRADSDARGDRCAGIVVGCAGIEFLLWLAQLCDYEGRWRCIYFAEIHALYTFATEGGTDGRRGRRLACADNQLDDLVFCDCFSRHCECG